MSSPSTIDWSLENSQFIPWNDGHTPESRPKTSPPGLRIYPDYHTLSSSVVATVITSQPKLADDIYAFTTSQSRPSWGSYVTMEEIRGAGDDTSDTTDQENNDNRSTGNSVEQQQQTLARKAAALFLHNAMCIGNDGVDVLHSQTNHLWSKDDSSRAHGVAVWGLAAQEKSQVSYHIDYAEWIRYSHGVTILPALAGTWQCTNATSKMKGGEFCVNTGGLENYRCHGYKGALKPVLPLDDNEEWIRIPYQYNQMILMSGHLPHLSTQVDKLQEPLQRVIVGFNVFLKDAGPVVQEAPEHSILFQNQVRRLKQRRRQLDIFQNNPRLSAILIHAKRAKVKKDFVQAQERLDAAIKEFLLDEAATTNSTTTVQNLVEMLLTKMETFSDHDRWPCNAYDIRAHVSLRWKERWLEVVATNHHRLDVKEKELMDDTLIRLRDPTWQ